MQTHEHFDGITLAPDGKQLSLDYYDYCESGDRRFFHYILSPQLAPRLHIGHSPISVDKEEELAYTDIPPDVIRDVCSWLETNVSAARGQGTPVYRILSDYLTLLEPHKATRT